MVERKYLFPGVIELNLQAGRPLGVNIYLIDGGTEWALIDVGQEETLDEVIELIRGLDFPLSKCKLLIATHADADHVQALAKARERLRTKTAAHPRAAARHRGRRRRRNLRQHLRAGLHIPMPPCKIDREARRGRRNQDRQAEAEGLAHARTHAGATQLSSSGTCSSAATTSIRTAASARSTPTTARTCRAISSRWHASATTDAEFLLPSHGPVFRKDPKILQNAIDRLTKYQHMADFGTCAVSWPLQEQWEKDILAGKMPEL